MVDFGVGQNAAGNRRPPPASGRRPKILECGQLCPHIGGDIEQKPVVPVRRNGDGRLRSGPDVWSPLARGGAVGTTAVPLRHSPTRRRTEDANSHWLYRQIKEGHHFSHSVPGSAWDRTAFEALPRFDWGAERQRSDGRQSLPGSAFPGRAWERAMVAAFAIELP